MSNDKDIHSCNKLLSTLIVPALKYMLLASHDEFQSVTRVSILNAIVFRELMLQAAKCLHVVGDNQLAKKLIRVGEKTYNEEFDSSFIEVNKLKIFLREIEDKEQQEEEKKQKSSVKPSVELKNKFDDDSFDDDWPSDDEDEKKKKIDKFKDDDESSGWGTDDEDDTPARGGGVPGFKELLNALDEDESQNDPIQTELFPLEYRFFKSRPTDDAMDQANQKPPALYSLKMNENEERSGFEGKKEMRLFLQMVISKHDLYANLQKVKEGSEETILENFHAEMNYIDKVCILLYMSNIS
jgi:hypothetical protein